LSKEGKWIDPRLGEKQAEGFKAGEPPFSQLEEGGKKRTGRGFPGG